MSEETKEKRRYHKYTKEEAKEVAKLLKRPELLISDIMKMTGLTKDTIRKINIKAGYIRKPDKSKTVAAASRENKFDEINGPVIVYDKNLNSYWKFDNLTKSAIYFKSIQPSVKSEESNIENVRNSIRKACRGAKEHKLYGLFFYFLNECDAEFKNVIDVGLKNTGKQKVTAYNVNAKKLKKIVVNLFGNK